MPLVSAGLLLYRKAGDRLDVLLVHPGGPYNAGRDLGIWTIPKGLIEPGEDALAAAQREFEEETGVRPQGPYLPLPEITQKGGKRVRAWAMEGDCDPDAISSNTFRLEWPPDSGRVETFPEVDRAAFFSLDSARRAILPAQEALLDGLVRALGNDRSSVPSVGPDPDETA